MNQNIIIGILLVLLLIGGGYFLFTMSPSSGGEQATSTATSTTSTGQNSGSTANPVPAPSPTAPNVVTDTSVAPTNSTAVVTGKVTPNGAPTTYWYEYGRSATLGQKTTAQRIGSGWSAIPSPGYITGLAGNTQYYFRLSAQNALGTTNGATQSFSTNNNPPGQGIAPAVTTSAATGATRVGATLNARVNPRSSPTTYWFEYGETTDFGNVTAFTSAGSGNASAAVSALVSGLAPQTRYYFRINAQNQYGTVNGTTQNFLTQGPAVFAPPVVTTQVASPVATTTATVRGTVHPYRTQTTYWFEYSTDPQFSPSSLQTTARRSAGAGATTVSVDADISGLRATTTYYYRTVAQNSSGTVRGDALSFTTK